MASRDQLEASCARWSRKRDQKKMFCTCVSLSEPPTAVTMPGCTSHCYNVCRQTECTRTSHPRGYCVRHCPNCKGMKKKKQSSAAAAASSPAEDSEGDQKPAAVEPRPPKETEHRPKKNAKKAARRDLGDSISNFRILEFEYFE